VKGSKWGSREVRNRAANGKVEVLGKLMREGPDEKLDLWLEIGHFQIFLIESDSKSHFFSRLYPGLPVGFHR